MKFSKLSQLALVSAIGLIVATLLTACQLVSIDLVYVAASAGASAGSAGQIYGYAADASSGAIRSAVTPVSSGGTNPVALAMTSDYYNVYVANQGNNSVVHFSVGDSGALTQKDMVALPNTPVYMAVNSANTYLYVVSGTSSATLTEYALNSGTIGAVTATANLSLSCTAGSPNYPGDTIVPTGVTVLANNDAVYVTAVDKLAYNPGGTTTSNANPGWIFGLAVGPNGAFSSPGKNCPITPATYQPYDVYQAGVRPSALATEPTSRFIFVTDYASNELIGYTVLSTDVLSFMFNGPFKTGDFPTAIAIDPRGIYMYITNSLDNTVSSYSIALPTGSPSTIVGAGAGSGNTTDTDPVAIAVEPALGRFVYTANRLGNTISGFKLNPDTGALTITQATPYPTGAYPMAIIAIPHGNHATQAITP